MDALKRRATDKPFSRWMSETPAEGAYHMVGSVKEGSAEERKNKGKRRGVNAATW